MYLVVKPVMNNPVFKTKTNKKHYTEGKCKLGTYRKSSFLIRNSC